LLSVAGVDERSSAIGGPSEVASDLTAMILGVLTLALAAPDTSSALVVVVEEEPLGDRLDASTRLSGESLLE
jgi:hypothetical protein